MLSGSIPVMLAWAHPLVAEWFLAKFGSPTEPQEQGWPEILAGRTTLISAPTGSGKTLAAFLICIDRLVRKAIDGSLHDRTEVLYVSPLKALGNDIQKNLEGPLGEIMALAAERGLLMPEIRTAVRTGDTLMKERREMLRRPPHILVTTPESLYILLTAEKSRAILRDIETVIVDEIHAVADDKRGAHLAISLERLDLVVAREGPLKPKDGLNGAPEPDPSYSPGAPLIPSFGMSGKNPTRIGLSATQKPIEVVAHFLTGNNRPAPAVVNIGHRRKMDLAVEVPASELGPITTNEMWDEIYDRIAELALQHRSTLVFVNTRRLAERVALHLSQRLGEDKVAAHHGSLARKLRLAAERKLKNGEIRALVATASLELGIDIGFVDLVCHISSPRSIAVTLQRFGRAGHWRGAVPKGRFFATTRDDLVECGATIRAIRHGDLDRLEVPAAPLDILAQQIVAMCCCEEWEEDALFETVRSAYPYRDLTREEYDRILEMLSLGIAAKRGRYGAYLFRDQVNRKLRARRGARLAAITSGGAIPETALFSVVAQPDEIVLGTLDEDFAVESNAGDIMLLGNTSWRITRVESNSGRVLVEDAHGAPPSVPFWRGEAPGRTAELSHHVGELRQRLSAMLPNTAPLSVPASEVPRDRHTVIASTEPAAEEFACKSFVSGHDLGRAGRSQIAEGFSPCMKEVQGLKPDPDRALTARLKPCPDTKHAHETLPLADGAAKAVPFQSSEYATVTSKQRNRLRGIGSSPEAQNAVAWLKEECGLDDSGAEQLVEYIVTGRAVLGEVPTQQTIIAERFFDEGGGMQLIVHAPFGARVNKAWGLALRKRFCRSFNFELQAAATDDGLNISLAEQHSFPLADVFNFLQLESFKEILEQAALASPIFKTRWRWDANRSLALLRFQGGKKVPPQIQRIRSDDLLASVFPDVAACFENIEGDIKIPDHPLIDEVMKDTLSEAMDIEGLRRVLTGIYDGSIRTLAVDTPVPSQFAHEILNANPYAFLDDAPLEERRARAVQLRRMLPEAVLNEVGRLDQVAIAHVREQARPEVRDADELHDALQTLVALPEDLADDDWRHTALGWVHLLPELLESWRVVRANLGEQRYYVASERAADFALIFPGAQFEVAPPEIASRSASRDDALLSMINGWMMHCGPTSSAALAHLLGLKAADVEQALLRLEASGTVLRGNFTGNAGGNDSHKCEWCERRLLARIHHLTVATLRKQVEPVTAAQYMRWLLRWQHVAPHSQAAGDRGVLEVVRQLQGFEIPANAWEKHVIAARVTNYDPAALDQLCLTGAVGWGRLSPHPATLEASGENRRRVVPTSVAPITLFVREDADWMQPRSAESDERQEKLLSESARSVLDYLRRRGASFFADMVRGTAKQKAEVETALWELVAAGLVTADGFANLRSLIHPPRRNGAVGPTKVSRPRNTAGRWSLLFTEPASDHNKAVEATCWMLLRRYGVVFREVLARESNLPKWREQLIAFRRLEDRGEVRGGRFVNGFLGEQFALPEAVESLRAMRNVQPTRETVTISAADPLNLVGFTVPGERVPAISGRFVTFRDGVAADIAPSTMLREAAAQ
jgi:ATP-dependent Lhr-like helicase